MQWDWAVASALRPLAICCDTQAGKRTRILTATASRSRRYVTPIAPLPNPDPARSSTFADALISEALSGLSEAQAAQRQAHVDGRTVDCNVKRDNRRLRPQSLVSYRGGLLQGGMGEDIARQQTNLWLC